MKQAVSRMEERKGVILNEDGKFTTSFQIPLRLKDRILGKGYQHIHRVTTITNTSIKYGRGKNDEWITVIGDTEDSVIAARSHFSQKISHVKTYEFRLNHFVSVPFINDQIKNNLKKFMENILSGPPRGVTESSFRCPNKVHLNISFLILHNDEEITRAKELLNKFYEEKVSKLFPKEKKHRLILQGLTILAKEDAAQAGFLYAKVFMEDSKENEKFQIMVEAMRTAFDKAGFLETTHFHPGVIIMCRLFKEKWRKYENFDVRGIMEKYGDFYFGSADFDSIHLSIAGSADNGSYYEAAHVIEI